MEYILRLYITGQTAISRRAAENIKNICDEALEGHYSLKVIDILKEPHLAEQDKILATPALIKELPPPLTMMIGDLTQKEEVLLGLGLPLKDGKKR